MTMHGLQPGVQFFERSGTLPYTVFVGILLAQFSFFGLGLVLARHIIKAVLIPNELLLPVIVMLSFAASFAIAALWFSSASIFLARARASLSADAASVSECFAAASADSCVFLSGCGCAAGFADSLAVWAGGINPARTSKPGGARSSDKRPGAWGNRERRTGSSTLRRARAAS